LLEKQVIEAFKYMSDPDPGCLGCDIERMSG
jgi:hypothetical protein